LNKLLKQYCLKKADELLKAGQNNCKTAYSVGFETPSYSTVSFKSFYGITPLEYAGNIKYRIESEE